MSKFQSVQHLLEFLPPEQLEITEFLRELVYESIPSVREKLSFNVPFFFGNRAICFIWPGAVPWGNRTKPGVEFGFNQANLLRDPGQYLERGSRKQVFSKRFFAVSEIPRDLLQQYLWEAAEIDELLERDKLRKKR